MLPAGCLGGFLGNDIQELFLGLDEVLHTFAGQIHQLLRLVGLPALGCLHPGMSLFAGNLQELLLHMDKSIHTATQQVGDGMRRRKVSDSVFHRGHENFVLFLPQIE